MNTDKDVCLPHDLDQPFKQEGLNCTTTLNLHEFYFSTSSTFVSPEGPYAERENLVGIRQLWNGDKIGSPTSSDVGLDCIRTEATPVLDGTNRVRKRLENLNFSHFWKEGKQDLQHCIVVWVIAWVDPNDERVLHHRAKEEQKERASDGTPPELLL